MYEIRTDLAIENREIYKERNTEESKGVKVEKKEVTNSYYKSIKM